MNVTQNKTVKTDASVDEFIASIAHPTRRQDAAVLVDLFSKVTRWVENYIKPGIHYDHLDRDAIWSSCKIKNHPMGRQKKMLELGLIDSFNNLNYHPSDNKILENNNLSVKDYQKLINGNL